ncbi:hypothetical protein DFH06DRAFT_1472251 [Mycena polygramma]|nr:hypothetical protein DFH06DRAFT_1472251 [Mycena polygramma]
MELGALLCLFILFLMAKCDLCGTKGIQQGRGMTNHYNTCSALHAQHTQGVQNIIAAESAAQVAAAALAAAPPPEIPSDISSDSPMASPPSPIPPGPGGRPRRKIVLPRKYRDDIPAPPTIIERAPVIAPPTEPAHSMDVSPPTWVRTQPNAYGLYKIFPNQPFHDPDESVTIDDLCKSSELLVAPKNMSVSSSTPPWFPFLNSTVARLMIWFHLGSNLKSIAELDSLVQDVLMHEDFDRAHLENFSTAVENKRLDQSSGLDGDGNASTSDQWKTASIKIKLPAPGVRVEEDDAAEFEVPGLQYRPLLDVLVEAFQSPAFEEFHITPFQYRWDRNYDPDDPAIDVDPPDGPLDEDGLPPLPEGHETIYSEIYTARPMLRAHVNLPPSPTTPNLETIIAAYMFWSDSTHLANFGNASLWPLYTFFGNLSKYTRAKPTSNSGYHQAYFPSLPDSLKDFYRATFGAPPTKDMMAHLKRELMHGVWDLLISPEFIHAYVNGIVVKCYDSKERLIFPRFFTYGADYPEKVLLATIKYFGGCPCPRCFIEKDQIPDMGTKADMKRRKNTRQDTPQYRSAINRVRRWIFARGLLVAGAAVARNLKQYSWVPTRNAFSKLVEYGFNFFSMFVPDLLHEVELGGWKSLFVHLLRVLQAEGDELIGKLDERFRKISTFGRSTIRRFHANVSELKKLAARDFEDILQCCFAVFEGLLPEPHNTIILTLIYVFATWHAYAKLRMHNDSTIGSFRTVTSELGSKARKFCDTTCNAYVTYELPTELDRRARQQARRVSKANPGAPVVIPKLDKERKAWSLVTYKWHSMGDYPDIIVDAGTTDSYSTQIGELAHRLAKRLYARTNKRGHEMQIARGERRRRLMLGIKRRLQDAETAKLNSADESTESTTTTRILSSLVPDDDNLPRTPPRQHHHISESKRTYIRTHELDDDFPDDPAAKDFLMTLKAHLLGRLLNVPYDGDELQYSPQDLADVNIVGERLYTHKVLRVNYTTYDVLRSQDTLNPRTHPDFMVLAHEDEDEATAHPYWYGRIISIFHAQIRHVGPRSQSTRPQRMEFLWVRWFGRDLQRPGGWKYKRPHRIGFLDATEPDSGAFSFLDPAEVIRAVHLIPAFHYGRTRELLPGPSVARMIDAENDEDYVYYYVNSFVDRDAFMRYSGDAVGHRAGRKAASAGPVPVRARVEARVEAQEEDEDEDEDEEMDVDFPEGPVPAAVDDDPGSDGELEDEPATQPDSDASDSDSEIGDEEDGGGEDGGEEEKQAAAVTEEDILDYAGFDDL